MGSKPSTGTVIFTIVTLPRSAGARHRRALGRACLLPSAITHDAAGGGTARLGHGVLRLRNRSCRPRRRDSRVARRDRCRGAPRSASRVVRSARSVTRRTAYTVQRYGHRLVEVALSTTPGVPFDPEADDIDHTARAIRPTSRSCSPRSRRSRPWSRFAADPRFGEPPAGCSRHRAPRRERRRRSHAAHHRGRDGRDRALHPRADAGTAAST